MNQASFVHRITVFKKQNQQNKLPTKTKIQYNKYFLQISGTFAIAFQKQLKNPQPYLSKCYSHIMFATVFSFLRLHIPTKRIAQKNMLEQTIQLSRNF